MFTGRRFDVETGLYYYRARMYDPYTGRFLQTDPIGYQDGINWYAYCGNNPGNRVDPSGNAMADVLFPDDDLTYVNILFTENDGTNRLIRYYGEQTDNGIKNWNLAKLAWDIGVDPEVLWNADTVTIEGSLKAIVIHDLAGIELPRNLDPSTLVEYGLQEDIGTNVTYTVSEADSGGGFGGHGASGGWSKGGDSLITHAMEWILIAKKWKFWGPESHFTGDPPHLHLEHRGHQIRGRYYPQDGRWNPNGHGKYKKIEKLPPKIMDILRTLFPPGAPLPLIPIMITPYPGWPGPVRYPGYGEGPSA